MKFNYPFVALSRDFGNWIVKLFLIKRINNWVFFSFFFLLQFWVLFSVVIYDLSSISYIPYRLSVDNLSVHFSSCSLMVETGRRTFLILSHTLLKLYLYCNGAAEGEKHVCVSPLVQLAQIPLFSTGSLCTPLGFSDFARELMIYVCCSPLTSCLCIFRYKV